MNNPPCSLGEVLARARSIFSRHTLLGGHRAFDILYLAGSLEFGAEYFLTFDRNQASLGLRLPLSLSR